MKRYKKALERSLFLLRESSRSSVYDDFENKIYIPVSYEIYIRSGLKQIDWKR